MSNAVATREPPPRPELAEWRKQDAAIAKMAEEYLPLKVNGLNDKKGLAIVHEARMIVKNTRIAVEKNRVELKADALEYGRAVDKEAKRLTLLLAPIEEHLDAEESAIAEERERIKRAAEEERLKTDEARKAKIKQRFDALQACGYQGDMMAVPEMEDAAFAKLLADAQVAKAEAERLAEEQRQQREAEAERLRKLEADAAAERARQEAAAAELRKAEETHLAAERAELDRQRKEQEAEAARLRAEQARIEQELQAHARAAELERARVEAAERARVETEQRLAREAAEREAAEKARIAREKADAEAKEAARLKAEAEKPQRDKLHGVALAVLKLSEAVPTGPGAGLVVEVLAEAAERIQEIANGHLA